MRAKSLLALLLAALLSGGPQTFSAHAAGLSQATGSCGAGITPALTEGPYYKAGSPERTSLLESGAQGTKLVLTGTVYDKNCNPISRAWLDFWQADAGGAYDNSGYKFRGHQFTDQSGHYRLETVVPGEYPGRTVHIHVKVKAPDGPILTTQLFVPGVARNNSDSIFNQALLMKVQDVAGGKAATFDFGLNVAVAQAQPTQVPTQAATTPSTGSHTFTETGFSVSGDIWTAWQGGRPFADSLRINGVPITAAGTKFLQPTEKYIRRSGSSAHAWRPTR